MGSLLQARKPLDMDEADWRVDAETHPPAAVEDMEEDANPLQGTSEAWVPAPSGAPKGEHAQVVLARGALPNPCHDSLQRFSEIPRMVLAQPGLQASGMEVNPEETAEKRTARSAYQTGTGGGVRGRRANRPPPTRFFYKKLCRF